MMNNSFQLGGTPNGRVRHELFGGLWTFVAIAGVLLLGLLRAAAAVPVVTGDRPGLNGTTHAMAMDGSSTTFFRSSYNDWQYLQVDFGTVGSFSGLRRYMTSNGTNISGARALQGEGVSFSTDGATWTSLQGSTTRGWEPYVNYGTGGTAWHTVPYGWSAWISPTNPPLARYVRFQWDGNNDALNEVAIRHTADFTLGPTNFGPTAARIGFDNLAAGAPLHSQLRMQGLRLLTDVRAPLTVANATTTKVAPHSAPLALVSTSATASVEIRFDVPRRQVGLYFARPGASGSTRATLQALDASGLILTQAAVNVSAGAAGALTNFIGAGVAGNTIQRLKLTLTGTGVSTVIDDLLVEPGQASLSAVAEAVTPFRSTLESALATENQKLDAIRSLQLLPSPAASQALQTAARSGTNFYVRERAIHALAQMRDPAALTALVAIGLKPVSPDLRRAAGNAVWALRQDFPMPDPPRVTLTTLVPPQPGVPYAVEARVVSPVDRAMVRIKFKSSKLAQAISLNRPAAHYVGPMRAGQEIVLRAEFIQAQAGLAEIPVTVRVDQNLVDGTTYEAPLYVDARIGGGSASMTPPPGWRDVSRHIVPLPRDPGAAQEALFAPAGSGERNTIVEGALAYEDGDTMNGLGFTSRDVKASRLMKVQIVEMADPDESFGEGWTDGSGFFSIPVEDVPDNLNLGLLLEVDNHVTKLYVDTDIGDEEFKGLAGSFNAGTGGIINAGFRTIAMTYSDVEVDENGFIPGGGEIHTLAFAAAMNINEVILVTREDMDNVRDPRESDGIGQVDVEYGDESWNHYFEDLVLTAGRIDGAAPSSNAAGWDYGLVDETIAHEYTHHLQYEIGSWDGHDGTHRFCEEVDSFWWNEPEFAWSEGFANYFGNYIAQTKPGMSQVGVNEMETACGTRGSNVTWHSDVRDPDRWFSVEGHVAAALWDLADGWGQGADLWDQVDGAAFNGHAVVMQIFDHELGDAGLLWGLFDDAPDLSDFYTVWNGRFAANDFVAGRPVVDPIFNRLGIIPGGNVNGTVRRAPPSLVVEGLPTLPFGAQASLVFTQANAHTCLLPLGSWAQYDSPVPAPFVPGQPVLTVRRHWSYLDAVPSGPDNNADTFQVRFGVANLGLLSMETDAAGSTDEATRATYTVRVQYGPGAANWLQVTTTNNLFVQPRAPELHSMTIRFLPAAFELAGGRDYFADVIVEAAPGTASSSGPVLQRIIRVVFNQLIGPDEDCDNDGLTNREERNWPQSNPTLYGCLQPRFADSDGDGLRDGDEVHQHQTSPCLRDTDGDGLSDGVEVRHQCLDPLVADAHLDPDGDGLSNLQELSAAIRTDPCDGDTDKDGALDGADNCRLYPNPTQSDVDGDGRGDDCDGDIDGDGCSNLYDPNPADVQHPDTACLARPTDPALTRDGRLIQELDPRLDDPRWQMLLDGIRPNGPDSCGPVSCPPPSATLIDPAGKTIRTVFASDLGFDQRSGFATVAKLLPDLDKDGVPEMAIAAPNASSGGVVGAGQVVIVSGQSGRELGRSKGQLANAKLGSSLALTTRAELAIGAPGTGESIGAVHLLRLGDFSTAQSIKGTSPGDRFGTAIVAGESGGVTELAIGAPADRGRGAVYAWNATQGLRRLGAGLATGDEFGAAMAWAGDRTQEGAALLVGAPGASRGGKLIDGFAGANPETLLTQVGEVTLLRLNGQRLWSQTGTQPGERFGTAVASVSVAGTGSLIQFLVGGPGWQNQQGRAYFLTADGEIPQVMDGQKVGGQWGSFVAAGPDLDGDGEPSFIIGGAGIIGTRGAPGVSTIVQAFVRPRIVSLRRTSPGRFEFRLRAEAGVLYELQASSDCAKWEKLSSVLGTGDESTLPVNSGGAHRFFRIGSALTANPGNPRTNLGPARDQDLSLC